MRRNYILVDRSQTKLNASPLKEVPTEMSPAALTINIVD